MEGFIMFRFISTTILGGLLFPVVFIVAIIGKALEITNKLSVAIAGLLPIDSIGGLALVELLALVILVLICFLAGLAAKTALAGKFAQSLEKKVLGKIPAYALLKSKAESALRPEDIGGCAPSWGDSMTHGSSPLKSNVSRTERLLFSCQGLPIPGLARYVS
jgi:hypothetical protein